MVSNSELKIYFDILRELDCITEDITSSKRYTKLTNRDIIYRLKCINERLDCIKKHKREINDLIKKLAYVNKIEVYWP